MTKETKIEIDKAIEEANYWSKWLETQRKDLSDSTARMDRSEKYIIEAGGLSSMLQTAIFKLNQIETILNNINTK